MADTDITKRTTCVFDCDVTLCEGNPHHIVTPFGPPVIVSRGDLAAEIDSLRAREQELVTCLERARGYLEWHADEEGPTDCPPCARMLAEVDDLLNRVKG